MKLRRLLVAACLILSASDARTLPGPPRVRKLTVLYFLKADGGLTAYIPRVIDGMESAMASLSAGARDRVNFVVQVDANKNPASGRYLIQPDTRAGQFASLVVPGREYTGDEVGVAHSLESFLDWASRSYPAESRVLVLSGHGTAAGSSTIGGKAEFYDASLPITALAQTLRHGGKLDVLALDSCLNQTVETLYELKDSADYIVGSEEVFYDFDYRKMSLGLAEAGSAKGRALAFVSSVTNAHDASGREARGDTVSAVKTDAVVPLATAVRDWALEAYKDCQTLIGVHRSALKFHKRAVGSTDHDSKDLGDLMTRYSKNAVKGAAEAKAVQKALGNAVVANAFPKNGSGIAIFLPARVDPDRIAAERYASLRFVREGSGLAWLKFLRSLNFAQKALSEDDANHSVTEPDEEQADACPTSLDAMLKRLEGRPYAASEGVDKGQGPY